MSTSKRPQAEQGIAALPRTAGTRPRRWVLLGAALALASPSARAQSTRSAAPEQDAQVWLVATVSGRVAPAWRYYGEMQPRFDVVPPGLNVFILRGAAGYQLSKAVSLWLGYSWHPTFVGTFRDEQRLFQQLLLEGRVGPSRLSSRTRLEERFLGGAGGASLRVRSQLRGELPLGGDWALAVADELFANLNTVEAGPRAGLDQNRLLAGVDRRLGEQLTLEVGYMFNFVWRPTAPSDRSNHNLVVSLAIALP